MLPLTDIKLGAYLIESQSSSLTILLLLCGVSRATCILQGGEAKWERAMQLTWSTDHLQTPHSFGVVNRLSQKVGIFKKTGEY